LDLPVPNTYFSQHNPTLDGKKGCAAIKLEQVIAGAAFSLDNISL
jgi:hypothetical protein